MGSGALAANGPDQYKDEAAKDLIFKGDAKCTTCHDVKDAPGLLAIGKRKHGTTADTRTPTCVKCHGESEDHIKNVKDEKIRPLVERNFNKDTKTPVDERNAVCLTCHQDNKRMNWQTSTHAANDLACASCHNVHAPNDKVRTKKSQTEVCYTCHKQQRTDMSKPSHHPVAEGKMGCSDCHNPHGSTGEKMLVKDTINATCFTCHAEKRGPFIHNHAPVEESCSNCHNPHGTTAPNMLTSRMPFLCQQCHGESSHPGNVPGVLSLLPNAVASNNSVGYAQARGCNSCHTAIHGSNNPSNATSSGAGRFFR
jgi:DmsE family decaheme c-type cytochrome